MAAASLFAGVRNVQEEKGRAELVTAKTALLLLREAVDQGSADGLAILSSEIFQYPYSPPTSEYVVYARLAGHL